LVRLAGLTVSLSKFSSDIERLGPRIFVCIAL
jgi:hypothetical protein